MKRVWKLFTWSGVCVILAVLTAFFGETVRSGRIRSFLIQSGSMDSAVPMGSIIVVRQEPVYSSGDIITFSDPQGEQFTTHRVVTRIDSDTYFKTLSYMTKGDANNAPDLTPIPAGDVIGRTVLVIPYLGFLNSFVRSQAGFVVFILIPGAFIIAGELRSIMGEVKTIAGSQRSSKRETDDEPAIPIPRVELRTT